ncbi:MAG: phosphoribosylformylglycinamidine synthase subunit PurL [Phycisphaerales bacterium]
MVHRIEVWDTPGYRGPQADAATRDAEQMLETSVQVDHARVYLIEADLSEVQTQALASELLADPIAQESHIGSRSLKGDAMIEVQPLPGVMDPDAQAIELAIRSLLNVDARVQTGSRYDFSGIDQSRAREFAGRALANSVIHAIFDSPYAPGELPHGSTRAVAPADVPIRALSDDELNTLSRDGHLFLSLEEMQTIQKYYISLGREPRDIELETLAQTWSEHCVHKTMKATIQYREQRDTSPFLTLLRNRENGHTQNDDGSITIHNLLRSTVAAATHELMQDGIDWCLSVFVDNAGVIAFDDEYAVCFKCETHNHPSAIEPYGGAATGIGGCIRDIIGTGLAARPIAATDVFCVAFPEYNTTALPAGCLHPRRILQQVVAGVRDYGNRMGIPTLNGAVWFDNRHIGNPLVFCGCIGVLPRTAVHGAAQPGDRIVAIGGRTGRDGIHGATFSSAELTDSHADEFSHAVQIGNAVTEKKVLDAILEARDHESGPLFSAITDCGAGGFSSAIGEMGEHLGATVSLENAPLKYDGLTPTEVWISEAQERMVLAVPPVNLHALAAICAVHEVDMCELGEFGTPQQELILSYNNVEFGRLGMDFLHNGVPDTTRIATWSDAPAPTPASASEQPSIDAALLRLLAHPNIASKHWIIRQYDHEVQGQTVLKPLVGPGGHGPGDAAVIQPVAGSTRGLGLACGLATGLEDDPYIMTLAAIDECVRNLVCVGTDPSRIAILDNFAWPGCQDERRLAALVRAAEACYDGALAYRTPFISGKDSLNNQFVTKEGETIAIPPTLLISGMGIVHDIAHCVTMDAKRAGNMLMLIGSTQMTLRGSHYAMLFGCDADEQLPTVDLHNYPLHAQRVHELIQSGLVQSAHDVSDGGVLIAAVEMAFAGDVGLSIDLRSVPVPRDARNPSLHMQAFAECAGRYLIEIAPDDAPALRNALNGIEYACIGWFTADATCELRAGEKRLCDALQMDDLLQAWQWPLDW